MRWFIFRAGECASLAMDAVCYAEHLDAIANLEKRYAQNPGKIRHEVLQEEKKERAQRLANARHESNRKTRRYADNRYKKGDWKTPSECADAITDDVVSYAERLGWRMFGNSRETVRRWLKEYDNSKESENSK